MGRSAAIDVVLVALLSVGQGGDSQRGASLRRVLVANEFCKSLVRRHYVGVDRFGDLAGQASLIVSGNTGRVFLSRLQKWVGFNNTLALPWNFLGEETDGHQLVFHAGVQDLGDLSEGSGNL